MLTVPAISLRRSKYTDPSFLHFCDALDAEFRSRYPEESFDFSPYNKIDKKARVVLAYDGDSPVGCGCFRPDKDGSVEIKRMYVVPRQRGKQIARRILDALEEWAMEDGFTAAKLETGIGQPEARSLYLRSGYHEIPNYPPYCDIALSICMQKRLG